MAVVLWGETPSGIVVSGFYLASHEFAIFALAAYISALMRRRYFDWHMLGRTETWIAGESELFFEV
jgi:hypothetical protein